jgi:hypothetical protein
MKIQINAVHNIHGRERLIRHAEVVVESTIGHLSEHVSRVEVHLSDENGDKGGGHDKRCVMEARIEGHQPIAVTHEAETIEQATIGAAAKLKNILDHTIGRLSDHEGRKHWNVDAMFANQGAPAAPS